MASAGKEPPDDILTKYYKCHPQTRVGAALCAIYLNFYHTREIVTKYNNGRPVKFINNALIICHDHPNVTLTSNLPYGELSSEASKLIAQIHVATKEQAKQEIIEKINLEKINSKEKDLNDIIYGDYSEIETLKMENQLLKELNSELKDKNKILNELLTKEKQGKNNNTKTYAEITVKPKTKNKRVPKLIIKKNRQQYNTDLQKAVLQHLQQDKSIQTKSVAYKNKDTVII